MNLYTAHLADWQAGVQMEYRAAWRELVLRLGALAAGIVALFGINAVLRHVMSSHVRDPKTREGLLVGERVLFWLAVIAIVLVAFAFDTSLEFSLNEIDADGRADGREVHLANS